MSAKQGSLRDSANELLAELAFGGCVLVATLYYDQTRGLISAVLAVAMAINKRKDKI